MDPEYDEEEEKELADLLGEFRPIRIRGIKESKKNDRFDWDDD